VVFLEKNSSKPERISQVKSKFKNSNLIIQIILIVAASGLLLTYPFLFKGYPVRLATIIIMYVALSQVWNILGGFAGYISLGLVGFIGVGAYTSGVLMNLGLNVYLSMLLAGCFAAIISAAIGYPVLRLKAGYFIVATYAVAFVFREIANNMNNITGGGSGLALPLTYMSIVESNRYFYYGMLIISVVVTLICIRISRSSLGYGLHAIKEDEDAANVLGINTTAYKLVAFILSSFIVAVIGGFYAYWLTYIDPLSAFDSKMSILVIIMTMVGGAGTVIGPIVGGVLISLLSEVLWSNFLTLHSGILGIILILTVIFLPQGVMDLFLFREEKLTWKSLGKIFLENIRNYRI